MYIRTLFHIHVYTHTQRVQSEISGHQSSLTALTSSLGHTMMDNTLPEDSVTFGSWLAQVKAAFEALQKSTATWR